MMQGRRVLSLSMRAMARTLTTQQPRQIHTASPNAAHAQKAEAMTSATDTPVSTTASVSNQIRMLLIGAPVS
jgi:hypothetical protein